MPDRTIHPSPAANAKFKPGDVLAFSGNGWQSAMIRALSVSPRYWFRDCPENSTHVEICSILPKRLYRAGGTLTIGSTTFNNDPCVVAGKRVRGVQAHRPEERVAAYDGSVWRLRPAPGQWSDGDTWRLMWFVQFWLGKKYDMRGALTAVLPFPEPPDAQRAFCSRFDATALMRLGKYPITNPSRVTPSEMVRTLVDTGIYYHPVRLK